MTNRYALPPLPEPLCNLPTYCQDAIRQYTRTVLDDHLSDQEAAIEADRKRRGEPAFYVNARIFDPATGKIKTDVNGALTWSEKPAGNWQVPVYTAPQPAEPIAMSLDDAIAHAVSVAADGSTPCRRQHLQLAAWLRELREFRCSAQPSAEPVKVQT